MQDLKYSCDVENILIEVKTHNYMQSESRKGKMEDVCVHDLWKDSSSDRVQIISCLSDVCQGGKWQRSIVQQFPSSFLH